MAQNGETSGCLGLFLGLVGIRPGTGGESGEAVPYRLRDDFLSPAERSLFGVLGQVVGARGIICPKVRLNDLIYVPNARQNRGQANRIDRKHVDFVICSPETMKPRVVVELDDTSHARRDRQDRDELVDSALQSAGLPIVRVTARRQYAPAELAAQILPYLLAQPTSPPPAIPQPAVVVMNMPPRCPKCGAAMVLRTASQGPRAGKPFYGCTNYPQCRSIVPVENE